MPETKPVKARELLLNETLVGFHAESDTARKISATTSGKSVPQDRTITNTSKNLKIGAKTAAQA